GLDWRMQYIYRYATAMSVTQPDETRAGHLRRIALLFKLDDSSIDHMTKIDADASIEDSRKPAEFARRAATTKDSQIWIKGVAKTDKNTVAKARQAEKDFLDSLKPLFP